jgi:hypothetical protein
MIGFAQIEWKWGHAILDESARDVFGFVGLVVTSIGFVVTIWQLWKTQSAAKAAEAAARAALKQSRFAFEKFASNRALRFLQEAKIHVDGEAWGKAAMRLNDLTHELNQLLPFDVRWKQMVDELHTWCVICNSLETGKRKRFSRKENWLDFCRRLEAELSRIIGPFSESKGEST